MDGRAGSSKHLLISFQPASLFGLPVAMAAIKILNKEITTPGVQRPINKEVYEPILEELTKHGITFKENFTEYLGYNPDNVQGY